MAGKRKDNKGRNLRTGEYYDSKNKRYIFQKMIDGVRFSLTAADLAELRTQEHELLCRMDKGNKLNTRDAKMPLNAYFDFCMETFAKSGRKATTCTNYKSYYNTNIRKTIGKKPIGKITKVDCQKIINDMIASGKKHSTMSNLKSCLNLVFECAIDDDIILKNPAKNLQIPQTESKKRKAIQKEDVDIFINYIKENRRYTYVYPEFVILFNLGVRIGEMAALTWNDIDFKKNVIKIDKTVNRYRKADYGFTMGIASPKSGTSTREVFMNNTVRSVLLKLKMQGNFSTVSLPYVDDSGHVRGSVTGFVFVNSIGNVWSEPAFLSLINRIVERLNKEAQKNETKQIENFCPHMARHTYTSLAYSAGADIKTVSQILGHSSTAITLDTYTHLTEEKKKEQEEVLQKIKIS